MAALVVPPAHAEEDAALILPPEPPVVAPAEAAPAEIVAAADAAAAIAHAFPPPPEVAPVITETVALASMPAAPLPGRARELFRAPPEPALAPSPADEALARAAIRTVAAFATPGWIAAPAARNSRWVPRVGPDLEAELHCLALNVYWEARSEPALGRLAVAEVTLNRVAHRDFPKTICDVVRQGAEQGLHRCQFSWVCDRRSNEPDHDAAWRDAELVAYAALFLNLPDPTRGALWYHADYVTPPWAGAMAEATRIGRHLFYRGPARTIEAPRGATG